MTVVAESVPMFETVETTESELDALNGRYSAMRASGLAEDHPRVQFVVTEFRRTLTQYEKIAPRLTA